LQTQFATETHLDIIAERLGLDPFEIRRINAMRDGATTHTKQTLGSVSLMRTLEAAEKASGWEAGAPSVRGPARGDLNHDDVRPPVSLGTRFAGDTKQEAAE
jgi:CO/xanthine dehydrogenase Mo-binding subunit